MKHITVSLKNKSYPIYIASRGWSQLAQAIGGKIRGKKVMIVCDENIYPLYYNSVKSVLISMGYQVCSAVIPPGEASKSFEQAQKLYTQALEARLDRSSSIIALGGGVVGDLAGFIAATYMRGIGFIQIPTSLLAQVDSSVGGKVAINHPLAKNIIGAFYQPDLVFIDPGTLISLPSREFATGLAELIKHAFIADPDFISWLEENMDAIIARDVEILSHAIYRSCQIKAGVVELDERETGLRMILNYGHTIGHAIEAATGYSEYTHGEAVAMGMVYEAGIAEKMGLIKQDYINRLADILERAGLPTQLDTPAWDLIIERMNHDKKNVDQRIVLVLPIGYGKVKIFKELTPEQLKQFLE
ncbi:MAG: 3-dehydroquinate synthase [Clostridiales bacterium]|jgi:3-dehydroquinate synthase|nr:3-dehydroquinate synthase [Clostridiales bacterium]